MIDIGFVGLGQMGANMCERLLDMGGVRLFVHDIDAARAAPLEARGAVFVPDARALAQRATLFLASLPNPAIAREVMLGADSLGSALRSGSRVADLSTLDPKTSREIAVALAGRGVTYIDTPVSGGVPEARRGALVVLAGAMQDELAALRPAIDPLARVVHCAGPRGAGSTVKLLNNLMAMGNQAIAAEAFVLGAKAGLEPGQMLEILRECGGTSERLVRHFPPALQGDFAPRFTVGLAAKDLRLVVEAGQTLGVPMAASQAVRALYDDTAKAGLAQSNSTAVLSHLAGLAGVEVRARPAG